jgi:Ca2+-binding RTX toxin-like protein
MAINGTKHDDDLTGTDGNDDFHLQKGGTDTASGGKGDDLFRMGATLDGSDRIDGGEGRDTIFLHGDYSAGLFLLDDTIKNVEVLRLGAGFSYTLGMSDGNVAAGETLTINASPLDSAHSLTFNGVEEHDGHFVVYAGAGDDNVTGGTQADKIHLEQGGNDTVHGGSGDDVLYFGTQLFATDKVFGDAGVDTLVYGGTFGAAPNPTFNASFIHSIESIVLTDSNMMGTVSFTGDVTGGNVGGLTVDASALTIATAFDFSSATSAIYHITGGSDNDSFKFAANFTNSDRLDGGAGQDTLDINASSLFSVNFDPDTIKNVETITLNGTGSVFLNMNDGNVAAGKSLTVTTVSSSVDLNFDGSAETDGSFTITGGSNVDTIKGGHGADTISGGGSGDSLTGGAGADTFLYTAVGQSSNLTFDGITDFAAGTDKIDTNITVLGVGSIEHHSVNEATFNQDLQAAGVGDDQLHPSWAHIVHADSGDFAGHDFLIIDANGTGQYEASFDYVIDITGYTGTVTVGDFI